MEINRVATLRLYLEFTTVQEARIVFQKIDKNCVKWNETKEITLDIFWISFHERFLFRTAVIFYIYIYVQISRAKPFYFKPDKELAVNEMQIEIKQEKI